MNKPTLKLSKPAKPAKATKTNKKPTNDNIDVSIDTNQLSPATITAILDVVEQKDTVIEVFMTAKIAQAFNAIAADLKQDPRFIAQGALESWMTGYRKKIKGEKATQANEAKQAKTAQQ